MGGQVFLSYARANAEFALRLGRDLRSAGIDVWIDQLAIAAGEPWDRAVQEALEACSTVIVVLSPETVSSRSVMDEVSYALEENKRLVPVLYRPCKIPFQLRRLQHVDFTSDYSASLSQLMRVLAASTPRAPTQHAPKAAGDLLPRPAEVSSGATPSNAATKPPFFFGAYPRLRATILIGLGGALYGAAAQLILLAPDPRPGPSLFYLTSIGALAAGVLWAIAGTISGLRKIPLLWAIAVSAATIIIWRAVYGTYVDVLSAAFVVGGPIGGIAGAVLGRVISKRSRTRIGG